MSKVNIPSYGGIIGEQRKLLSGSSKKRVFVAHEDVIRAYEKDNAIS